MTTIELRRLALTDLRAIEEIERSSYPTPWSRSMFAGELAKPSSICLGAFEGDVEDGKLCGYLVVSRYVDAWHVMNIAVDLEQRGRGIATILRLRERNFPRGDVIDILRDGYQPRIRIDVDRLDIASGHWLPQVDTLGLQLPGPPVDPNKPPSLRSSHCLSNG